MNTNRLLTQALAFLVALAPTAPALADPCGMVPPIWLGAGKPLERTGVQRTYVFHKNGIESLVIRPGFSGKVDEFGMLIPFPSPPAIRKVADDVFSHVAAAVDPPEVVVDLRRDGRVFCDGPSGAAMLSLGYSASRRESEVVVLRREAVGMYEVAVLEAGSSDALRRWMDDNGFRYPTGMDAVCEDYVEEGWCFVAVKARVGRKDGSEPRPGMRDIDTALPAGATFDGHVQAMGFRFFTDELVVPMRLSAFNDGELRNVVYVLSDGPLRVANLPEGLVVRQVPGREVWRNLTDPLPLRVIGGELSSIPDWRRQSLPAERDPLPHNGIARELFASDLLAARTGRLAHGHEELEKELLEIGEQLGLRGPELDALHHDALAAERERVVEEALGDLAGMALTVVDGDFPRQVIAAENLRFGAYAMPAADNAPGRYDAKVMGPAPALGGTLRSAPPALPADPRPVALFALVVFGLAALVLANRRRRRPGLGMLTWSSLLALLLLAPAHGLQEDAHASARDVEALLAEARSATALPRRGRAVVALSEVGGEAATRALTALADSADPPLVRIWAAAGLARAARSARELAALSPRTATHPALVRPYVTRWRELLDDPDEAPLELVLQTLGRCPALQQELLPALLDRPTADFLEVMLHAQSQQARRLAAGCLATLAGQGRDGIAAEVVAKFDFDPDAERVPWSGGALFVPSLGWTREEARGLMRALVAWHLWCDGRELTAERQQLHNNLSSWGLANAAGYSLPGGQPDTVRWLQLYGETVGVAELMSLLAEQGLEEEALYAAIVRLVELR